MISQAALDGISVQTNQFKKELTNDEEKISKDSNTKTNEGIKEEGNDNKNKALSKDNKNKKVEQNDEAEASDGLSKEEKKD